MNNKDLTVLVPCYNEKSQNLRVIRNACKKRGIRLLIIDDGSKRPIKGAIRRWKNKGCGSAIKYGLNLVRTKYTGIIDADGQYDINDLFRMWRYMADEDQLIGRRMTHQGSSLRFLGRLFLKIFASILVGRYIPDLNTGVRIFKTNIGKSYRPLMCDQFSYCSSITLTMILDGYRVDWYPIGFYARKGQRSTVKEFRHGLYTIYQLLWITIGLRTRGLRKCLRGK